MKSVKKCTSYDLFALEEISINTYKEAFGALNDEKIMSDYLESAFNLNTLYEELNNQFSEFYFLYYNNCIAGYFKINEHIAQTDIFDSKSIEIQRLYIKKEYQNIGLGKYIMDNIIKIAQIKEKLYLWLGVWDKNKGAIEFYEKNGFYIFSTHLFYMGNDMQNDFIMKKNILNI